MHHTREEKIHNIFSVRSLVAVLMIISHLSNVVVGVASVVDADCCRCC